MAGRKAFGETPMTLLEKVVRQLEIVLEGDAANRNSAAEHHVDYDRIEHAIQESLKKRLMFGTGDPMMDLAMSSYCVGRRDQFIASMTDLIGQEEFEKLLNQTCIKLGIQTRKLN
jgi:hypothetical protein